MIFLEVLMYLSDILLALLPHNIYKYTQEIIPDPKFFIFLYKVILLLSMLYWKKKLYEVFVSFSMQWICYPICFVRHP